MPCLLDGRLQTVTVCLIAADHHPGAHRGDGTGVIALFGMVGVDDHHHRLPEEECLMQGRQAAVEDGDFGTAEMGEEVRHIAVGAEVVGVVRQSRYLGKYLECKVAPPSGNLCQMTVEGNLEWFPAE